MSLDNFTMHDSIAEDRLNGGIRDPQRSYDWEARIIGLFGRDALPFQLKQISIPERSAGIVDRYYINRKYTATTRDTSPNRITATFWDIPGTPHYLIFHRWLAAVMSKTKTMAPTVERFASVYFGDHYDSRTRNNIGVSEIVPMDFMKEFVITLFDTSGDPQSEMSFLQAFPISVGEVGLDYETSDVYTFTVTFAFNYIHESGVRQEGLSETFDNIIGNMTSSIENKAGSLFDRGVGYALDQAEEYASTMIASSALPRAARKVSNIIRNATPF